jgi:tetratricopeptide (TPR) repeat protein
VTILLDVDGDFGALTYAAVKQFQRKHPPLKPDGIVGEETWAAVEAIPDDPTDRNAMSTKYYEAAAVHYKAGHFGHAADFFEMASEWSVAPELVFNRAQALRRLGGRRKEAMALYEQFIVQVSDADSTLAKRLLAELRGPGKTGDNAADAKTADALYERAARAYKKGRYGEAADLFEMSGEATEAPELLFNRAQALRRLGGRRTEAMALYEQFIAQVSDPDSALARRLLGELRGPGKTGNADADAKAANELYERAAAAYKKGSYGEALDLFEAASEVEDAPELLFNRAQALRRLGGRRKDAMALYAAFIAKVGEQDSELARRLLAELTVPGQRP